jgi:uncharacterized protein YukE
MEIGQKIGLCDDAFDRGRADVRQAALRVRTTRDRADQRVTGFVRAGWKGQAAEAFLDAWHDWCAAAEVTVRGLVAMADLMDATQRDLHAQDAASRTDLAVVAARVVERLR